MNKEIIRSNVNVTSMKHAFLNCYLNIHLNQDHNLTPLQSIVGQTILKLDMEEKGKERIINFLKKLNSYDSLRKLCKKIQVHLFDGILYLKVFKYDGKWFYDTYDNQTNKLFKDYEKIDNKALTLNGKTFQNFSIDNISLTIKKLRDKKGNDYEGKN
jgi:hypothetical protein